MKSTNASDDSVKSTQSKSTKKSTKSRSKSSKTEQGTSSPITTTTTTTTTAAINSSYVVAPTTPTSSTAINIFDPTSNPSGVNNPKYFPEGSDLSKNFKSHHKNYAGFEPRSIKIIWEQHDQSDVELSQDVCTRLAEDVSYKVWELINEKGMLVLPRSLQQTKGVAVDIQPDSKAAISGDIK